MAVDQISVFLENETGGLADVADVLARSGVDIRAMALADETDFGILRLIVNDAGRAMAALKDAGAKILEAQDVRSCEGGVTQPHPTRRRTS